jgi:hypothetical protein
MREIQLRLAAEAWLERASRRLPLVGSGSYERNWKNFYVTIAMFRESHTYTIQPREG